MSALLARRINRGEWRWLAAAGRDPHQTVVAAEDDGAVLVPGPAQKSLRRVADGLLRPAGGLDLLHLSIARKNDEPAIRGPERIGSYSGCPRHPYGIGAVNEELVMPTGRRRSLSRETWRL